jgi:hypothetical protein
LGHVEVGEVSSVYETTAKICFPCPYSNTSHNKMLVTNCAKICMDFINFTLTKLTYNFPLQG